MNSRKILPNVKVLDIDLITLAKLSEKMPVKLEQGENKTIISVRLNIEGFNVGRLPQKYEEAVDYYWYLGIDVYGEVVSVHFDYEPSELKIDLYAQYKLELVTCLKSLEASSPEESRHDRKL